MTAYLFVAVAVLVLFYLGIRFAVAYFRLRGTRVVSCPADRTQAAVDISAAKAAAGAVVGKGSFQLTGCSHWPERQGCGQQCLSQIETSPTDCLVRTHLTAWYEGRTCALCLRPVGRIDWYERRPALMTAQGHTLSWSDVDAGHLDEVLRTHKPVCFDCHVAETFRQTHPELVLDNRFAAPPSGRVAARQG